MKDSTMLGLTAIICGTVALIFCIHKGYDTGLIATFFTLLGTIIGYAYGVKKKGES